MTNSPRRLPRKILWTSLLVIVGAFGFQMIPARSILVDGQRVPSHALRASRADFEIADDVVALHYYGVGGWGISWQGEYLLTAPYFSNHGFLSYYGRHGPDTEAVRQGVSDTPFGESGMILVGHGHVDHAADIPAYFAAGLPVGQSGIIANRTTLNMLASMMPPEDSFRCAAAPRDSGVAIDACRLAGFRITPLASAHAPNVKFLGMDFTASKGSVDTTLPDIPDRPSHYYAGETWAFLIDLLDDDGEIVFRIHYMDAVAGSQESNIPAELLAQHDVDLHIACVPGYTYVDDYPEWVMQQGRTGFVLLGHWEDFFQPADSALKPVTLVLSESRLNDFVNRIGVAKSDDARPVAPLNKSTNDCAPGGDRCGPIGRAWALPVPGETYHFKVDPGS